MADEGEEDDDEPLTARRLQGKKARLLTRTSTLGKTGLKKCAESLLGLLDSFADESVDADVCKQDMDALFWDMEQMEFEANKTDILSFTSQRELEAYETLNAEIGMQQDLARKYASIEKVSKEIEELKTKVHVEKTVRAYKEEYESIARVINELPSRQEIAAEIAIEEKRSSEAVDTIKAVDSKLDLRNKQFSLLMSTIQNLKATLDEDVEMEEEEQLKLADAEDEDMEDGLVPATKSPQLRTQSNGAGDEDGVEPSSP